MTTSYSPFGCPGDYFINRDNLNIKIIIDPPSNYFPNQLITDREDFDKLVLIQGMEPKDINNITDEVLKNKTYFDLILTSFEEILSSCNNSKHFLYASCWILTDKNEKPVTLKKDYHNIFTTEKKFKLSHVMSQKNWLPGHNLRHRTVDMVKKERDYELFFPKSILMSEKYKLFKDSMFHITIENTKNHNYISEKIVDCFMSYTVPIYWGCPNIGDYFNTDGIITFQNEEELDYILNTITQEEFNKRIPAIQENYQIAFDKYAFWYDRVNKEIEKL